MRPDPSIADTIECQAIVDRPQSTPFTEIECAIKTYLEIVNGRFEVESDHVRSARNGLRATQPLPVFCPEVRPLSQWSPCAIDRLLADWEVSR